MKTALLLSSVASASALRGKSTQVSSKGVEVEIAPPDAACFQKALTEGICGEVQSSSGGKCMWCQTGHESGICVSENNAKDVVEAMGQPCPNYSDALVAKEPKKEVTSGPAPPDLNCFSAAWYSDKATATCGESKASDGTPCVWCPLSAGMPVKSALGACLSREEAVLADGKLGLDCPAEIRAEREVAKEIAEREVKDGIPDVNCFKAAWVAENAEDACGESKDQNGNACVWCATDGDVAGACLSQDEAGMADGQFGLKCPSGNAGRSTPSFDQWLESAAAF
ncbi:hypothetical protein ACHAXT_003588 [Thalassiosira profunda]